MPQAGEHNSKIALITGSAKRIGRTIAIDLANHGWKVAIHYHRSESEAHALANELTENGCEAICLQADLNKSEDTEALVPNCIASLGTPTCLINNGSVFQYDDIQSLSQQSWDSHMNVNLLAPVLLSKSFAEHLRNGTKGNIINIIDQRVWKLTPQFFSYTIAKSALWTATQTLSQALAPHIRVNAIGPGPVLKSVHQDESKFAAQQDATLLAHPTAPEDIANAIQFILNAPSLTGQMIALDSGQHLAWQTADVLDVE